jgi:hypothetical protein
MYLSEKMSSEDLNMSTLWKVLLIILVVLIIALIVLYFVGRRLERRQAEQQVQIEAAKQNVTLLIIDKKRVPLKDAGLPDAVIESTPKLLRRSKMPIVKVKYGPKVMNMVADEKIFDMIPLKKEVRATVSGIYITDVRGLHGSVEVPQTTKKKGIFSRLRGKAVEERDKQLEAAKQDISGSSNASGVQNAKVKSATKKKYRPKKKRK